MHRVADLPAGNAKTDAQDAYMIAETARNIPATLRTFHVYDEQVAELAVLAGLMMICWPPLPPPATAYASC